MDLCNQSCSSGQPVGWQAIMPSCVATILTLDIMRKIVQPVAATHVGTIDFNHFIPPPMTLTLAGDHKVSSNQNLLASFSCTCFN